MPLKNQKLKSSMSTSVKRSTAKRGIKANTSRGLKLLVRVKIKKVRPKETQKV